jgi:hypothetical protein
LVAGLLTSCQTPDSKLADDKKSEDQKKDASLYPEPDAATVTPEARKMNDTARLFAGMSALEGQEHHANWRGQDFWQGYRQSADAMWKEFAAKRGNAVRKWSHAEAADLHSAGVVFQPLQGPNFVFSHLMMPQSDTLVVCGQVPCLDLPEVSTMDLGSLADTIHQLRGELAGNLELGPVAMPPALGAVPTLMALAVRTGHVIDGLEIMPPKPAGEGDADRNQPGSACVVMMHDANGRAKKLFYFQQDLSDAGLTDESAVLKFLAQQGKTVAVLRNTAHELHQPAYTRLRDHLLNKGVAFVQDPSGMPMRSFDLAKWNLSLYGAYTGAPNEHRENDQPDLIAAYQSPDTGIGSLPFTGGLISEETPAALIIARPQSEPQIDLAVTPLMEMPEPASSVTISPTVTPDQSGPTVDLGATPAQPVQPVQVSSLTPAPLVPQP